MKLAARASLVFVSFLLGAAAPEAPKKLGPRPMLGRLRPNLLRLQSQRRRTAAPIKKAAVPAVPPCLGIEALTSRGGERPFAIGEELAYELDVAGAYLGRFETKVGRPRRVNGREMIPLFGRARTSSFISTIKPFSGRYMSMVDPRTLRPIGLKVEAMYGDDDQWEKVRFSENLENATVDFRLRGQERKREWKTDHQLTDLLSMLYAARSVQITPGMAACQDVFGARRLWRMDAKVSGIERVKTPIGKQDAYLVKTTFHRKPHSSLNNTDRPKAEIDIYFSTDGSQTPLMFLVRTEGIEARGRLVRWSLEGSSDDDTWGI